VADSVESRPVGGVVAQALKVRSRIARRVKMIFCMDFPLSLEFMKRVLLQ